MCTGCCLITVGGPGRPPPPFWRTLKESCKGLGPATPLATRISPNRFPKLETKSRWLGETRRRSPRSLAAWEEEEIYSYSLAMIL